LRLELDDCGLAAGMRAERPAPPDVKRDPSAPGVASAPAALAASDSALSRKTPRRIETGAPAAMLYLRRTQESSTAAVA